MRNIASFAAVLTALLFLGCDVASYSIVLTNDTETKTVSYAYNGITGTLAPRETRLYEVGAWTQPPANVVDQNGIASVNVRTNGITGDHDFVYSRAIILNVKNTLPVNLTVRADNFIDSDGSMELAVDAGETETAVIYTENPNFTAEGNFPVRFDVYTVAVICDCDDYLECVRDGSGLNDIWDNPERRPRKKMYVTIR